MSFSEIVDLFCNLPLFRESLHAAGPKNALIVDGSTVVTAWLI